MWAGCGLLGFEGSISAYSMLRLLWEWLSMIHIDKLPLKMLTKRTWPNIKLLSNVSLCFNFRTYNTKTLDKCRTKRCPSNCSWASRKNSITIAFQPLFRSKRPTSSTSSSISLSKTIQDLIQSCSKAVEKAYLQLFVSKWAGFSSKATNFIWISWPHAKKTKAFFIDCTS